MKTVKLFKAPNDIISKFFVFDDFIMQHKGITYFIRILYMVSYTEEDFS